jgi:hypothetical protein
MTTRTSIKTVTFRKPFHLGGFDEALPAGAYTVETDEELLEGISFPAYRRILTVIHLHSNSSHPGHTQTLTIDPDELDAALGRDQATATPPAGREDQPTASQAESDVRPQDSDRSERQATERGENEGMMRHTGHAIARWSERKSAARALGAHRNVTWH